MFCSYESSLDRNRQTDNLNENTHMYFVERKERVRGVWIRSTEAVPRPYERKQAHEMVLLSAL